MKVVSLAMVILFAISLAVASACGGGNEKKLEQALQSVKENDLAIMVLPQEDVGEEFADLQIDDESGFVDNEEAADDTVDPEDTADALEQAGRIIGYDLGYSDDSLSALQAGEGVISVGTDVDLFRDAETASAFVLKQVNDYLRLEGQEIEAGITLEKVDVFAVDGLADEAMGVRARASLGDVEMYMTFVGFRLDRLLGSAAIGRADDADALSQVEDIARALEQRMKGVLVGDIGGTPVPVLQAGEEATVAPPSEGEPDLAAMALSLDDLPGGVSIDQEGYVEDEDTVASYEREFDLGLAYIGSSRPMWLESDIDLYDNATEASGAFAGNELLMATSESAPELFASFLSEGAGVEATNVRGERLPTPGLGDESLALRLFVDWPFGSYESNYVFVRTGPVIGTLVLTGLEGDVAPVDALPLAEAMATRMAGQSGETNGTTVALNPTSPTSWLDLIAGSEESGAASESSCGFPADVTSYRYSMKMSMKVPESMGELGGTTEEDGLEDGLGKLFDGSLLALLEDMKIEGAYVAPDRSWARARLGGEEFAESIRIGERSWTRLGGMDWTEDEAGPDWAVSASPTFPEAMCDVGAIDALFALLGVEPQEEAINGIKATHYHIDETDMLRLAALFGEVEGAEEIPESAVMTMDIWLAEDGNWPVRMEADIGYTDEAGQSFAFKLFMEVKDINDPDIEIEPPI
jgi:hypothetical protein